MSCDANFAMMGGACAPAPLVRDWRRVAVLTGKEAGPGRESFVKFHDIDAVSLGLHAHIRALRIVTSVKVLGDVASNNPSIPRHAMYSLISGLKLSDAEGWRFLDGDCDGRDIMDAEFFRDGLYRSREESGEAIAAALPAAGVTVPISLTIDLAGRVPGRRQAERLIPVAALHERETEAFRFKLRESFPFTAITADLTIEGYYRPDGVTPGVEIWADVVDLDKVNVPPRWALRNYEKSEPQDSFKYPDAQHLFLVVRPRAEDEIAANEGEELPEGIDGMTLKVGGRDVLSNMSAGEWLTRDAYLQLSEPESYLGAPTVFKELPIGRVNSLVTTPRAFAILLPPRSRHSAPAGRVTYAIETNPAAKIRVLHEIIKCGDPSREGAIKRATGMVGAQRSQVVGGALVALPEGTIADKTGPVVVG